jgi:two-component system sensor histidine kinase TctE
MIPAERPQPWSVRRRLLALLLAPVAALLVTGLLLNYLSGIGPLRSALDRALAGSALVVAAHLAVGPDGGVTVELPAPVQAALRSAGGGALRHAVYDADGHWLAGDRALPPPVPARAPGEAWFADGSAAGEALRIAWLPATVGGRPVIVASAEPAGGRARATLYLLTATLTVDALLVFTILALVVLGVRRGLQPLLALRDRLAARSASELEPLDPHSVPAEVRTLVAALNALFERVRAADEAQQKFHADAAHQVPTPLAGIQAQIELLERDPAAAPLAARIGALHAGVRRLAHTAHQLLTLARAGGSATLPRDFRPLELRSLLEQAVGEQLDRALAKGIDLGLEAEAVSISGVDWLLRELIGNLLDNALKYTPGGGRVTLRCGAQPAGAYLEVEDDGPGIPLALRSQVAQRFQRAAATGGSGSGLGLAIVGDIAALHAARLSIGAGAGERGTRVRVDFGARGGAR